MRALGLLARVCRSGEEWWVREQQRRGGLEDSPHSQRQDVSV